jgi:hypothetical protein
LIKIDIGPFQAKNLTLPQALHTRCGEVPFIGLVLLGRDPAGG